jgi:hypothetical protein
MAKAIFVPGINGSAGTPDTTSRQEREQCILGSCRLAVLSMRILVVVRVHECLLGAGSHIAFFPGTRT